MEALRTSIAGIAAGLGLAICFATPASTPRPDPALDPARVAELAYAWIPAALAPAPIEPERIEPPFESLRTTDEVVARIRHEEGLRLEAYWSPSGWLIGYGHAGPEVASGMQITEHQAEEILHADLARIESEISTMITVPVNEEEFSALVGLAYNIGAGAFAESTVLRELNAGDREAAADAFLRWNKLRLNGELVVSRVLAERRRFERAVFLGET